MFKINHKVIKNRMIELEKEARRYELVQYFRKVKRKERKTFLQWMMTILGK